MSAPAPHLPGTCLVPARHSPCTCPVLALYRSVRCLSSSICPALARHAGSGVCPVCGARPVFHACGALTPQPALCAALGLRFSVVRASARPLYGHPARTALDFPQVPGFCAPHFRTYLPYPSLTVYPSDMRRFPVPVIPAHVGFLCPLFLDMSVFAPDWPADIAEYPFLTRGIGGNRRFRPENRISITTRHNIRHNIYIV